MNRTHRFALVLLALPLAAAEFGDLPSLKGFGELSTPATAAAPAAPTVVVPVDSSHSGSGTVYYDVGDTVYGSDGSTATRYGDAIYVRPSGIDTVNRVLEE
ncbi:hypothetical protein FQZ97_642010 [compost metagenome]